MGKDTKTEALGSFKLALAEVRKTHKANAAVIVAGTSYFNIKRCPTGIPSLDYQLGGGIPMGRGIHIFGKKHGGKTFLAMRIAAALQCRFPDKNVLWLDFEHAFEPVRAACVGLDLARLLVVQPVDAEDGLQQAFELLPWLCAIVTDSVAAINPAAEVEGDMATQQVAAASKVLSKFYRKWNAVTAAASFDGDVPTLVWCNQIRDSMQLYVKKTKTTGGHSIGHNVSVELEVQKGPLVKLQTTDAEGHENWLGHEIEFVIPKNNTFQPDKKGTFLLCTRPSSEIGYPLGMHQVDWPRDLVKYAVYYGVLEKAGSWYKLEGQNVANSKLAMQKAVFEQPCLAEKLDSGILKEIGKRYGTTEKVAETGKTGRKVLVRKAAAG